ncbi:hypothetical protein PCANC_23985 [Puccinia coronata f. sp. avenae]|uniref:MIF4G domain-containing protein n=1 Tax=Puccinia coronata f. sp. avenae TaxID=200324 RepID=A0A2N5TLU4_9BASI|nr:hypothetical protein PCANC_23985 [Puccinia coronata f. sp. avenae]
MQFGVSPTSDLSSGDTGDFPVAPPLHPLGFWCTGVIPICGSSSNFLLQAMNPPDSKNQNSTDQPSQPTPSAKRASLRLANLSPPPRSESHSFDSSLKKNTAFIKRLKTGLHASENVQVLIKETATLSLDKYLSEISIASNEGLAKCKSAAEIWGAIEVISALHQRFSSSFTEPFIQQFLSGLALPNKQYLAGLAPEQREREENSRIIRQRSLLRCLAEFDLVGLVRGSSKQGTSNLEDGETTFVVLKDLLTANKEALSIPLPLAVSFSKQFGSLYLPTTKTSGESAGPTPSEASNQTDMNITDDMIVKTAIKEKFRKILGQYFDALSRKAVSDHLKLQELEKKNSEAAIRTGQIFDDRVQNFEKLTKEQEKLWNGILSLAETLSLSPPTLPGPDTASSSNAITGTGLSSNFGAGASELGIWSDEEEKKFYEDLPDLKDEVPTMLLGLSADSKKENEGKADQDDAENETNGAQTKLEEEMEKLEMKDMSTMPDAHAEPGELKTAEQDELKQTSSSLAATAAPISSTDTLASGPAARLTALFTRLDEVYNSDALDKIAVEFAYLNSKAARNRLIKHLSGLNKNRTDLIRYYARMLAIISKYMPDVLTAMLAYVHDEFRYLQRKRKFVAQELHSIRSKNIRWISELTKFNLVPAHLILHIIKVCIEDLHGTNVENLCDLLEGCGRWVLNHAETSEKMAQLLDQMKRKKASQNLDSRQIMLLENAYFQCNPPDRPIIEPKHRTPMELFIRYLLYDCLSKKSVDRTIKTLRKLDWNDPEVVRLLKNILTKVWKVKFGNIYLLAIIVYDLSRFHPDFTVSIVDQVLENIRYSMEINIFKHNQQRIATIKYLGELYNYRVIDSRVIFDTLWSFVTFGHLDGRPFPDVVSPTDAPDDFFRIRMVCTLLNTCGHCFDRGSLRRRLNNFLKFFIMYLRCKESPPMDIDFLLQDTFEELRPKLNIYSTYEEASKAVQEMFSSIADRGEKADEDEMQEDDEGREGEHKRSEPEDNEDGGSDSDNNTVMDHAAAPTNAEFEEEDLPRFPTSGATAEEEEEFEKELAKMIAETSSPSVPTESSTTGARKGERNPIAGNLFSDKGLPILKTLIQPSTKQDPLDKQGEAMTFTMLTKKGNKQQLKTMQIPSNSSIAVHTRAQQMHSQVEHQQLKKLVLDYEMREEANERKNLAAEMARRGVNVKFLNE